MRSSVKLGDTFVTRENMTASDYITQTKAAIAQLTDTQLSPESVDINNCDREPIHIPAAIQPHGVLIVLSKDFDIVQISQNSQQHLGRSAKSLLNGPLTTLLSDTQIELIQQCLSADFDATNPLRFEIPVLEATRVFAGIVHQSGPHILLELEPETSQEETNFFNFYNFVKRPITRIQQTQTLDELCQVAVQEVKRITGFDRVMVYKFDADGSGNVVAEAKQADLSAYLGLRYPPTDIPKQAKYLYVLNLLRLIPDVSYQPVPLVPSAPTTTSQPLDMSLSTLRSVSPLHTEYLTNMGVRASMSISLIQDHQLWGLIACHHTSPRQLPYELRTVCEFLGQTISLELATKESRKDLEHKAYLRALQTSFVNALTSSESLKEGLIRDPERLLGLAQATGAAFCEKGHISLIGKTPIAADIAALTEWLGPRFEEDALFHTDCLKEAYPAAAAFSDTASGLLAIAISRAQQVYVLWFRPEVVQTVDWAGDPRKPVELNDNGSLRMLPRKSFELWKETVRQRSLPWKSIELEAALELRGSVIGLVLKKADELAQLNTELERSNLELDSFAYIASHDLKEPLRGIHNYSSFLIEDYGQTLGEDGTQKLETLMRLTQRMEDLINSLLYYSRLGRAELVLNSIDLNAVVKGVIDVVKMSKPEKVDFRIPRSLPVIECDRNQIVDLFTNLVSNGIKYNNKDEKWIEIGYVDPASAAGRPPWSTPVEIPPEVTVLYVRDNGIGIREKHRESIFKIFKRLHAPSRFGGGTGAGLTIAKKIVERHQGQIWVESVYGEGSTFYFTLRGWSDAR